MAMTGTSEEPPYTYTVSARAKRADVRVSTYLKHRFRLIPRSHIESIFGFVEHTTLYGGRMFSEPELSEADIEELYELGIGVRLPLTNHHATREEYEANQSFLAKYHRKGNSVILTNDDLARWIKVDFPDYRLDASVIQNINTHDKIMQAMELYDEIVLPMTLSEDLVFLEKIEQKKRITLFANAGCAYHCPSKMCYSSISEFNKGKGGEFRCSQRLKERKVENMKDFPLEPLIELGFRSFKLLRSRGKTGF